MKYLTLLCAMALSATCNAATCNDGCPAGTNENPAGWGDTPVVKYPLTEAVFYGSGIDTSREWNICTGSTEGNVEVHMRQEILPVQYCPGEYVVVRVYMLPDGTVVKREIKRLSDGPVPI